MRLSESTSICKGSEAFTESELNSLLALASSCPFINGTAVYKARTILASINTGIYYDDVDICQTAGIYKNGNAPVPMAIDLNLLETLKDDGFKLYPNPTSDQITIDYAMEEGEQGNIVF